MMANYNTDMQTVHIIFHSATKQFMVDSSEIKAVSPSAQNPLQSFLEDLNAIQRQRRLKIPCWFLLLMTLYFASFGIVVFFIWYVVIACTFGLILLLSILLILHRGMWKSFAREVESLCLKHSEKLQPHFTVVNLFMSKDKSLEKPYDDLAIMLIPTASQSRDNPASNSNLIDQMQSPLVSDRGNNNSQRLSLTDTFETVTVYRPPSGDLRGVSRSEITQFICLENFCKSKSMANDQESLETAEDEPRVEPFENGTQSLNSLPDNLRIAN